VFLLNLIIGKTRQTENKGCPTELAKTLPKHAVTRKEPRPLKQSIMGKIKEIKYPNAVCEP
jgi:hypothetical protein